MMDLLRSLLGLGGRVGADLTEGSFWMPVQGSTTAGEVDFVFYFIFWISALFFALVVGITILFLVRFHARPGHEAEESPSHNTSLELLWSVVPSILVMLMFWFGFKSFMDQYNPPANAYEVNVTAAKWYWEFQYPNGYIDKDLHVPVDTDVRLVMTSQDVIHSFFVPAFRVKKDVVPGRYNKAWFHATEPGNYTLFCTEYCGTGHSDMLANVVVHAPGEFEKWLDEAANFLDKLAPAEAGELLYQQRGCTQCHSIDGISGVGPSFKGLWMREEEMADGEVLVADENYIRESIIDPQARIVSGYDGVMPTYAGRLKDKEITMLIEYIKTLAEGQE